MTVQPEISNVDYGVVAGSTALPMVSRLSGNSFATDSSECTITQKRAKQESDYSNLFYNRDASIFTPPKVTDACTISLRRASSSSTNIEDQPIGATYSEIETIVEQRTRERMINLCVSYVTLTN